MTVTALRRLLALVAALLASVVMAGTALGHAALVSSSPAEGARVAADQVRSVTLTFDDELDAAKSQFELVDEGGTTVATGKVGADVRTMTADGLSLAAGSYEARWTAGTSDGHITRGILSFLATASASASPSAAGGSPAPPADASITALAPSSPAASASSAPVASTSTNTNDVVVPIAAASAVIALVAVLAMRRTRAA